MHVRFNLVNLTNQINPTNHHQPNPTCPNPTEPDRT